VIIEKIGVVEEEPFPRLRDSPVPEDADGLCDVILGPRTANLFSRATIATRSGARLNGSSR
jgi:hypothetical protein